MTSKECQIMEPYPYGFELDEKPTYKWLYGEVKEEKLILYPHMANMMLCWEKGNNIPKGKQVTYSHNKAWKQDSIQRKKGGFFYNESLESVDYYLDVVVHDEDGFEELRKSYFQNMQCGTDGKCGTEIWKYIKKEL